MTESQPKTAPSAVKAKTGEDALPSSNPPRQDALPADAIADEPGAAALQKLVQENADKRAAQGFIGRSNDPTPRENYTLAGVTSGKPTPETIVRQDPNG